MRYVATVEVRMTSSRLPGKPLMKSGSKSMLEHLVARLKRADNIDDIVIATTHNDSDLPIVDLAKNLKLKYFCGDESNVLSRVIGAAESVNADVIVEITGDCPLIDPGIIDQLVDIHKNNDAHYVSNAHIRSYPDGMDVQIFSLDTLKKSYSMTNEPLHLEHVSLHIRENPQIFRQINIVAPKELYWPELGLTLDEESDFILIDKIFEHFDQVEPNFNCLDIINFLKSNTKLVEINKGVVRKGDT